MTMLTFEQHQQHLREISIDQIEKSIKSTIKDIEDFAGATADEIAAGAAGVVGYVASIKAAQHIASKAINPVIDVVATEVSKSFAVGLLKNAASDVKTFYALEKIVARNFPNALKTIDYLAKAKTAQEVVKVANIATKVPAVASAPKAFTIAGVTISTPVAIALGLITVAVIGGTAYYLYTTREKVKPA